MEQSQEASERKTTNKKERTQSNHFWLPPCMGSVPMHETQVQSLGQEDPLEEDMATHSSTLTWRVPWTEEPGGPQSMESQRVRHDLSRTHASNCVKAHQSLSSSDSILKPLTVRGGGGVILHHIT